MELHHRLRRDPSWHPSGCNICGQLGHQAAQCTTGTVNWRAMYGENAFTIRPAVFQSDIDKAKKAKQVNFDDLERRARDYAKMRLEGPPTAQQPAAAAPAAQQPPPAEDPKKKEEEERRKEAEKDLPEGWAVAFDAQKKPYFWHKQTKKVQWDKPTADTPIN
ncbi:E3 ubiquitin- ligase Su(dx)-like [Chlorella sorokiniana]|uniref:E3 ubiquitin-ligase Su(Dx)-like n=1 Tax=Chlorella sorokiniana TaxID=3076 RepID=A0A2P6TVJ8_CHLSO|nr:E3 ubiquitin- ligase Su(dx)-like [Chlorella sorokiniana]|eukprot:PRW58093.1 E3 ubiquitin- ligase Su(dx)-like [Chlorella sorokiniana]